MQILVPVRHSAPIRLLQGLQLDLGQTNQVHLPAASPQQIKLTPNYILILWLKKPPQVADPITICVTNLAEYPV